MTSLQLAMPVILLAAIGLTASYFDFRYRRLPNWLCAVALAGGLAFSFHLGGWSTLGWAALHAVIALAVGAGLFALGWIGGGDAKFYASIAAWFGLGTGFLLLSLIAIAGFALAVIWFISRNKIASIAGDDAEKRAELRKMPYGIAISLGAVATSVLTAF